MAMQIRVYFAYFESFIISVGHVMYLKTVASGIVSGFIMLGLDESVGAIPTYTSVKNISIKMLKDVGMTVPKSRETSAVQLYIQQDRG